MDMNEIMKQAQLMQERMQQLQAKIAESNRIIAAA